MNFKFQICLQTVQIKQPNQGFCVKEGLEKQNGGPAMSASELIDQN